MDRIESATVAPQFSDEIESRFNALVDLLRSPESEMLNCISAIYEFVDAASVEITPHMSCKGAGCNHCCHINVHITPYEAAYISILGCVPISEPEKLKNYPGKPCSFLGKNGECTIYSLRPFACRTHYAFDDPENCQIGRRQRVFQSRVFSILKNWLVAESEFTLRDIRDYFPSGTD